MKNDNLKTALQNAMQSDIERYETAAELEFSPKFLRKMKRITKNPTGKRRVRFGVKLAVAVAAVAVLGIVGVSLIIMNKANVATADTEIPAVKSGTYYLNGDKNSDFWLEVNPEFLIVKGDNDKLDAFLRAHATKVLEELYSTIDPITAEELAKRKEDSIEENVQDVKNLCCVEKDYFIASYMPQYSRYLLKVSRTGERVTDRESLRKSDAAFIYNSATNTITIAPFGEFILVE